MITKRCNACYMLILLFIIITWPIITFIAYSNNLNYKLCIYIQLSGLVLILIMWLLAILRIKLVAQVILSFVVMIAEYDWMIVYISRAINVSIIWKATMILQISAVYVFITMEERAKKSNIIVGASPLPKGISSIIIPGIYIFLRHILPNNHFTFIVTSLLFLAIITLIFLFFLIHTCFTLSDNTE